jgi:LysR family transcriptional activator of nhaA
MQNVRPNVVAEFDDSALMKTAAADGLGVVPVAVSVAREANARFGLVPICEPLQCGFPSYIITVERSLKHAAVRLIAQEASSYLTKRIGGATPTASTPKPSPFES